MVIRLLLPGGPSRVQPLQVARSAAGARTERPVGRPGRCRLPCRPRPRRRRAPLRRPSSGTGIVQPMQSSDTDAGPLVSSDGVTFRLHHPPPDLAAAWLFQEVAMPRGGWSLEPDGNGGPWRLRFPRPAVDRMEYLIELLHGDGRSELVCDPANPLRAPGPFGDKSVIEFPEYRPPGWVVPAGPPAGTTTDLEIDVPSLSGRVRAALWTS